MAQAPKIHFPPETLVLLRQKSAETGAPIAELVRRAVTAWLGPEIDAEQRQGERLARVQVERLASIRRGRKQGRGE
jgi:hypothetical protein